LALLEENKEERAVEFYDIMSQFLVTPSTPTLFHSGLKLPQLSSCFLLEVQDDLRDIFKNYSDVAQLSKFSGGVGTSWSKIRSTGANIKTTNVESQGVIPFLKIANDVTVAINRSGKRRGAACVYLATWHLDIEDFIDLKKNTGDDRRRCHDMNTANWISDLFMKRVMNNEKWTLFSPDETPDLCELYGKKFEEAYTSYENKAKKGKIKKFKIVEANKLWRKMITSLFETGHPWVCFSCVSNIRSPQDHCGVIHSSNLCCVSGDEWVATKDGIFTVLELYERKQALFLAGKEGVVMSSPMLLPRPDAPMVKILTREGYSHKVTPDHKVFLHDGRYVEAHDLEVGDKIALQADYNYWSENDFSKEAFLAGLVCGDGTYSHNSVYIDVWKQDACLLEEIESTIEFVLDKYKLDYDHACNLSPKFSTLNFGKYRLSSSALRKVFEYLEWNKEDKLSVPKFVRTANKDTVSEFLRGLYLCDGTVQGGEVTVLSLCSTNKQLLEHLQIIWANLGCKTSISLMDEEGWRPMPDGNGEYKYYYCKAKYRLFHTSIQSCKIAEDITGLGKHRGNDLFLENLNKDGYKQKLYATFIGLEKLENEDAYCVSVDSKDHLWTCNGLLTKNTEITLNTSVEETAVCNLNSLNLDRFMTAKGIDKKLLTKSIKTAVRMLDNVIDINFYPIPEAKNSNEKHRPVGLGTMGWQDALFKMNLNFEEAHEFIDETMEFISYHAISASSELAKERGAYSSFEGSKWDRGIFPLDTLDLLEKERGSKVEVDRKSRLDWDKLKSQVKENKMRNSNVLALAPNATISTIVGCYPCVEPQFSNIYVKSNMSGEFTIVNEYLVKDLKKLGLWGQVMLNKLKYYDGDISKIEEAPDKLKDKYKGVFDIDQKVLIDLAALRSKWIDQSQSLNLFVKGKSGKLISDLYIYGWTKGLKTNYYLRTLGVSQIEKSTLDASYGLTQKRDFSENGYHNGNGQPKLCKLEDPTCESCQ